ncbi:hypothetical protein Bra3105_06600 [Brachybacterium halotolerans subsp. kimchii]|uniref:hypothetical protein n=1 Tax=Brachybacterium halotolerans TaxID=2795215 RepID=UPI001E38DF42|nr:hypothetical protein [Brachybacterium halotolerans]UEJ83976.1 hypothetical protein Bra3105_06600 [Brachybacterium halotolerans subsp. kimchii]
MTVMFGPAGGDPADFQPLGWIDSLTEPVEDPEAHVMPEPTTATFTARLKGPRARQPWWMFADHYTHPRQVLHNGRKPR